MLKILRLFVLTLVLGISSAHAAEAPASIPGSKVVTADEVKAQIDKGIKAFDARKKAAYLEGHLPKAVNIDKAIKDDKVDVAVFGADKAAAIIIYGHGPDGSRGINSVKAAVAAGFTNVMWFRDGFAGWLDKKYPTE